MLHVSCPINPGSQTTLSEEVFTYPLRLALGLLWRCLVWLEGYKWIFFAVIFGFAFLCIFCALSFFSSLELIRFTTLRIIFRAITAWICFFEYWHKSSALSENFKVSAAGGWVRKYVLYHTYWIVDAESTSVLLSWLSTAFQTPAWPGVWRSSSLPNMSQHSMSLRTFAVIRARHYCSAFALDN